MSLFPVTFTLQTMPCNIQPCFSYNWHRGDWSQCQFETDRGCGYGERHRLVECQRSDGLTVDNVYCINQGNIICLLVGFNIKSIYILG